MKALTFTEYQNLTQNTAIYKEVITEYVKSLEIPNIQKSYDLIKLLSVTYVILGLAGEAAECANSFKKIIRDNGGKIDNEKGCDLISEANDANWYIAQLHNELKQDYNEGAIRNIQKLADRKNRNKLTGSGDQK